MILYLLRHTKTSCPEGMCYGQTDVSLALTSHEDINSAVERCEDIEFSSVYSSPLQRCALLAKEVARGKKTIYDNRLMELNFGTWEGRLWNDIDRTEEAKQWFIDYQKSTCPQGESYNQLIQRVAGFLDELLWHEKEPSVVIVTHGGVIRAIHSIVNSISPIEAFRLNVDYGQLLKMEYKPR